MRCIIHVSWSVQPYISCKTSRYSWAHSWTTGRLGHSWWNQSWKMLQAALLKGANHSDRVSLRGKVYWRHSWYLSFLVRYCIIWACKKCTKNCVNSVVSDLVEIGRQSSCTFLPACLEATWCMFWKLFATSSQLKAKLTPCVVRDLTRNGPIEDRGSTALYLLS